MASPKLDQVLARLTKLHPRLIDLSLDRMMQLLQKLGRPEQNLPPVVHVAGTNGKGSLIAYMRAGLEAAGYRVHVFTSPHLVRFNERIRLAGRLIEDSALLALLENIETLNGGDPITQFEITTAAAFRAFADAPADILLLETGLGGEFDATNVIARPLLTVITPIDFDHMEFLGPTLADIVRAKAGIIKSGVPLVLGRQREDVRLAIDTVARQRNAPCHAWGRDWSAEPEAGGFVWRNALQEIHLPLPNLPGVHQIDNAAAAITCLQVLSGFDLKIEALRRAMRDVSWPARLQRLHRGPLVAASSGMGALWLDGGHNPHGARALRFWAEARQRLGLILAMKSNKDVGAFLQELAPVTYAVAGIPIAGDDACHLPETIARTAKDFGLTADTASDAGDAVEKLRARGARDILICGSLYLAGVILSENG